MKRLIFLLVFLLLSAILLSAQARPYQQGTVIRMRIADCSVVHSRVAALAGMPAQNLGDTCPEYTVMSDKVVYVVVGRRADQLMPLAETIDFRLLKNDFAVRIDDARRETRFGVKEMTLRSEWEREENHRRIQMEVAAKERMAGVVARVGR